MFDLAWPLVALVAVVLAYRAFRSRSEAQADARLTQMELRIESLAKTAHDALTEVKNQIQRIDNRTGGEQADRVRAAKLQPPRSA